MEQLQQNINRAGIVGSLVANDFKSSMLIVPLLDKTFATGCAIRIGETARDDTRPETPENADRCMRENT
ncbi:putative RND superfamily exporter [Pseudomonas sp. G5(2012)]|nr:putative RND superfamily exporter [Pseudomonas sp. G5(2012)]